MSVTNATSGARIRARPVLRITPFAIPVALYAIALGARVLALLAVRFPLTEGSAYYVSVARNIASGRGFVIDSLWSYSTPPLELPRAAFELWQPLASILAAAPVRVLGPGFVSAQIGFALFGALLAPLTWLVARDAARRVELPPQRVAAVAAGAGVLAGVAGPLLLSTAVPDSTLPFTVLAVAACVVMPKAARGDTRLLIALGVLLGLAYLTRMEAAYLGLVFVPLARAARSSNQGGGRQVVGRIGLVAVVGALVALPWSIRNFVTFGSAMPGHLADNAFLTRNDQIFAYSNPPSLAGFLAQGPLSIVANVGAALWHDAFDVLLVPGNVIVVTALVTLAFGWRRRSPLSRSPLWCLIAYGAIAFLLTSVLFPVATLWGTFEHAAGPIFVGLIVIAALGGDAFVARVRDSRSWARPNVGMAPAALAALTLAMAAVQIGTAGADASATERRMSSVAQVVRQTVQPAPGVPVLTDRPMWLSDALGVPALVLPDESAASVLDLARRFSATSIVLVNGATNYPNGFTRDGGDCFRSVPTTTNPEAPELAIYSISEACR